MMQPVAGPDPGEPGGAGAGQRDLTCPRCGRRFTCHFGDPRHCACSRVVLGAETLSALRGRFTDCLCAVCLGELAAGRERLE